MLRVVAVLALAGAALGAWLALRGNRSTGPSRRSAALHRQRVPPAALLALSDATP